MSHFSSTTRNMILARYGRCALCYVLPPVLHYYHILDKINKPGYQQYVNWLLIAPGYNREGSTNGIALCSTCHLSYFTGLETDAPPAAAFAPCPEIIQYLLDFTNDLDGENIDQLLDALRSNPAETEAAKKAKPFIDCYELHISAIPDDSTYYIVTRYLPPPYKLNSTGTSFISAENEIVVPGSTIRIFDAKSISEDHSATSFANIHFSPPSQVNVHTDLSRLLWRLEGCSAGAFLMFLAQGILKNNIKPKSKLLERLLDRFMVELTSVADKDQSIDDVVKEQPLSRLGEYVSPKPESTPSNIVSDNEMAMWRLGPKFSANDGIRMKSEVTLPNPWHQYRPKNVDSVPLRV